MKNSPQKAFCLILLGPTASGKTALSLELAEWLDADIISADSRQIFRKMNIGTATPTKDELSRIKHYFINEKDPDEAFSAGEFCTQARKIINDKVGAGKSVIVCGGSGLYIQAVRGMISDTLTTDEDIRHAIQIKAKAKGWPALYDELKAIDPDYAANMDGQNPKRVSRALEIWEMTGRKPSEVYAEQDEPFPWPQVSIGLAPERKLLYDRINRRVLDMIDAGLVKEVKDLLDHGYRKDLNALNTVGYKEIISYLEGNIDLDTAISELQKNTRHFAKRQMTWFRKYSPDHWITYNTEPNLSDIVERAKCIIVDALKTSN
jgi:tRNA dimethylallyltransferase